MERVGTGKSWILEDAPSANIEKGPALRGPLSWWVCFELLGLRELAV